MVQSLQILIAFFLSFFLVYITIPVIVRLSKEKKLFDVPNERKVNKTVIPNLGGVSIFLGITVSTLLSINKMDFADLRYILAALIIMFYTGIKDDILIITPKKKFILQVLCGLILSVLGDIRFTNLYGIFGIQQIGWISSTIFSVFVFVAIINSINLIDGIDGLASGLGILISLFFGISFFNFGHLEYALLCFATFGSLIPFFIFNVFGKTNRIFMGDTGALILGLLISIFVVKFNELSLLHPGKISSFAPAVSMAVVFVPLFDMVRVFCLRLIHKRSPFSADKNHIHHKLLELGYTHLKSTLLIVSANLIIIALMFASSSWNIHFSISMLIVVGLIFNYIPDLILKKKARARLN